MRICNDCGKYMTRGYVIENGIEYYCSEECLNKHYTESEYLTMYDDGNGDSYYTEWDDEIEDEIKFVKAKILDNDYFGFKKMFDEFDFDGDIKYEDELNYTLGYCLHDGFFNPYLDKEYIDCAWVKNKETGLIYNIDDIYDVFYSNLCSLQNDLESETK